jgi:hypothetical protein
MVYSDRVVTVKLAIYISTNQHAKSARIQNFPQYMGHRYSGTFFGTMYMYQLVL